MNGPLADLARWYAFNTSAVRMFTDGFTREDWRFWPRPAGNAPIWNLVHLADCRATLLERITGSKPDVPGASLAETGAVPDPDADWPEAELVLACFAELGDALSAVIPGITAEQAAEDWGGWPTGGKDLAEGLRFMYFHECAHIGQLGLLRRLVGKPGVV